ncbi:MULTISPECIES: thermonuclease family protein [Kribbella]|uniref:thermonuclease family protein n=1 Tax=Kribbella TaxID=182639 RepID=UPI001052CA50|nr:MULTISPECIES: thermonuclease family protein [Kribbella]
MDGDTIKVSSGQTVRLIGIDTPERGQCGYEKAREHLQVLLAGDPVLLIAVPNRDDKDRYGRLLRYVIVPSLADEDAGLNQIQSGLGIARYDGRDGYGTHPKQVAYIAADAKTPAYCSKPTVPPTTKPSQQPTQETEELFFANCAEARASGVPLPLTPGAPGWNSRLDRDKDGKACE